MIPIYKPYITPEIMKYAHDAIDSGWISSLGEYKEKATEKLREISNVKHVLLLNSGTAAMHLIGRSLSHIYKGIRNVIVPNNVYVAAWNGFLFDGKFKLIPVDADQDTWTMDLSLIPQFDIDDTAILAVHNVSGIVNVPFLNRIYPRTIIIEDACEGFLGKYEGKSVGSDSLCSAISFFGNKTLTCGEGGALLTNNSEIYDFAYKLHGQGQSKIRYIHDEMGYNYRMTNIQAAILYGQLEALPKIQQEKKRVFDLYRELISQIKGVQLQSTDIDTEPSNWMMGVLIMNMKKSYSHLEKYFKSKGIEIRPLFYKMSEHPYLQNIAQPHKEAIATVLSNDGCMLPSYPDLTNSEVENIVLTLADYTKKYA